MSKVYMVKGRVFEDVGVRPVVVNGAVIGELGADAADDVGAKYIVGNRVYQEDTERKTIVGGLVLSEQTPVTKIRSPMHLTDNQAAANAAHRLGGVLQ